MAMRRVLLATSASLMAALPLPAQPWAGPAGIEVRASSDSGPLAGARVTLSFRDRALPQDPPPVATDADGRAAILGLAAGTWQVEIAHPDTMSYVAVVVLVADGKPEVTASFLEATATSIAGIKARFSRPRGPASPFLLAAARPAPSGAAPAAPSQAPAESVAPPEPQATLPPATEPPLSPGEPATPVVAAPAVPATPPPVPGEAERKVAVVAETPEAPTPSPVVPPASPPIPPSPREVDEPGPSAALEPPQPTILPPPAPPIPEPLPVAPRPPEPAVAPAPTPAEIAPVPPAPSPPAPPLSAPVVPSPSTPPMRSYAARTCFECKPGEWAATAAAAAAPTGPDCATELLDGLAPAVRRLADADEIELASWAGSLADLTSIVLAATAAEVGAVLAAVAAASPTCAVAGVVLPVGARFSGFQYEVAGDSGLAGCLPDRECDGGAGRWLGPPRIERGPNATVVYGLFENLGSASATGYLTVFFAPPTASWHPDDN